METYIKHSTCGLNHAKPFFSMPPRQELRASLPPRTQDPSRAEPAVARSIRRWTSRTQPHIPCGCILPAVPCATSTKTGPRPTQSRSYTGGISTESSMRAPRWQCRALLRGNQVRWKTLVVVQCQRPRQPSWALSWPHQWQLPEYLQLQEEPPQHLQLQRQPPPQNLQLQGQPQQHLQLQRPTPELQLQWARQVLMAEGRPPQPRLRQQSGLVPSKPLEWEEQDVAAYSAACPLCEGSGCLNKCMVGKVVCMRFFFVCCGGGAGFARC